MSQVLELQTGYAPEPPPLSKVEQEREVLRQMGQELLDDDRFDKAHTLMIEMFKFLSIAAGRPYSLLDE